MSCTDTQTVEVTEQPKKKRRSPVDYGDLTGRRFGKVTVLEKVIVLSGGVKRNCWKYRCDCGTERVTYAYHLVRGDNTTCNRTGCRRVRFGVEHPRWKGHGKINGRYLSRVRRRARIDDIEFNLTVKDIHELLVRQDMKCAISGLPIEPPGPLEQKDKRKATASLDRIDSAKGYTMDNVQWVHKHVNSMKMDFPQEYFVNLCRAVAERAGPKKE